MSNVKFFICKHCGNMVEMINESGVPMICCGDEMDEIVANTVDASKEKHVPVITVAGNLITVEVGAVAHPMTLEHHIAWIYLETEKGAQKKTLKIGGTPQASFLLEDDQAIAAYAYCNLHGLWKTQL